MYRSGQNRKRPRGFANGVRKRAGSVYQSDSHIFNKPHGLIAAGHQVPNPKVENVQGSGKQREAEGQN